MSTPERPSASYLVRVIEPLADGKPTITVQNLRTGEMRSFREWSAFVAFAERAPKPGSLK